MLKGLPTGTQLKPLSALGNATLMEIKQYQEGTLKSVKKVNIELSYGNF